MMGSHNANVSIAENKQKTQFRILGLITVSDRKKKEETRIVSK